MRQQRYTHIPFSVDEMLEELAGIILLQGDYIWLTSGRLAAEKFVGFVIPEDEDCLSLMSSARYRLRIDDFLIRHSFSEVHDFAFSPTKGPCLGEDILPRLRAFMSNTPRVRIYPLLERQPPHSRVSRKLCQTTVDVASARWKLEFESRGEFALRELGLLANVGLEEILTDIKDGRLNAISRPRFMTVMFEDAKRWLLAQPAFKSAAPVAT